MSHLPTIGAFALLLAACTPRATPRPIISFPAPSFARSDGAPLSIAGICVASDDGLAAIRENLDPLFARTALPVAADGGRCDWTFRSSASPPPLDDQANAAWTTAASSQEGYGIFTTKNPDGSSVTTRIVATTARGAYYGVRTALSLAVVNGASPLTYAVTPATLIDSPALAARGVVEGFYGTPYADRDRVETIRRMAELRQNRYVYGPKGDPFVHALWARPYDSAGGAAIAHAAAAARAALIDFVWAVAPASLDSAKETSSSIRFSSADDFQRLVAKIESVRRLGVQRFGLFLDDTVATLQWPEDQAAFATLADAHVSLINRLQSYLVSVDATARLMVVGSAYTSQDPTWRDYNRVLGDGLRPDVDVLWTGPNTFSATLDARDMEEIDQMLHRPVVIWDNFPLEVSPPTGRADDLSTTVAGLVSNPILNEFRAHPVQDFWSVLGPLADYEWSPERYDAIASFQSWQSVEASAAQLGDR